MKITIETTELNYMGNAKAIIMGYLREHPNFERLCRLSEHTGISEDSLKHHLCDLETMGYIKKIYAVPWKHLLKGGRKLIGVEVLK